MRLDFIQWRLTFHAWSPGWPPRYFNLVLKFCIEFITLILWYSDTRVPVWSRWNRVCFSFWLFYSLGRKLRSGQERNDKLKKSLQSYSRRSTRYVPYKQLEWDGSNDGLVHCFKTANIQDWLSVTYWRFCWGLFKDR